MADIVLVHSRLLGSSSWGPLVRRLEAAGHRCTAPEPDRTGSEPTSWHELPSALAAKIQPSDRPLIVSHSGGGLLAAPLATAIDAAGIVFLDARIPPEQGPVAPAEPEFVETLRLLVDADGLLPPWSRWWGEDALPALIDDPTVAERFSSDEPRLPIAWYDDSLDVPAAWDERPIGYIRFSEAYDPELERAVSRRWKTERLEGTHLHHLNVPEIVARAIDDFVAGLSP